MTIKQVAATFKKQRYGLLALGGVLLLGLFMGGMFMPTKAVQATQKTCPAGTYQIGWDKTDPTQPVCKNEPTGCPFGDSVPMDKCAPPPDLECNADWTECHPKTVKPAPAAQPAVSDSNLTQAAPEQQPTNTCVSK